MKIKCITVVLNILTEYVIFADISINAQHVAGKFLPSEVVVALRGCEWKHGIVKFLSFGIFNYVRVLAYLVKRFAKCALRAGYGDVEKFQVRHPAFLRMSDRR